MADRLLILDFDGTLCLGDGPVRAFAREVATTAVRHRVISAAPALSAKALL